MAAAKLLVDLDAIAANWLMFQDRARPASAAAVVKADAYGLGAPAVAKSLQGAGCECFYVAWPEEGALLRKALGERPEIMVFHGPSADTLHLFSGFRLVPVLNSLEQIDLWVTSHLAGQPAAVHVDTGMNRLGLPQEYWQAASGKLPDPVRVISHLSCGDEISPANAEQLAAFRLAASFWPGAQRSLSATGGAYLGEAYRFEEIRPGIGLYGGGPAPSVGAQPRMVVRLMAPVLQVRDVRKGETAGYGRTWTAKTDGRLATIGLGYSDGYMRSASNRGEVFVSGERRLIAGRVSMDLIIVDVTGLCVAPGDEVEVLGPNITLRQVAAAMGTIDYEILTRLGPRLARIYSGGS